MNVRHSLIQKFYNLIIFFTEGRSLFKLSARIYSRDSLQSGTPICKKQTDDTN